MIFRANYDLLGHEVCKSAYLAADAVKYRGCRNIELSHRRAKQCAEFSFVLPALKSVLPVRSLVLPTHNLVLPVASTKFCAAMSRWARRCCQTLLSFLEHCFLSASWRGTQECQRNEGHIQHCAQHYEQIRAPRMTRTCLAECVPTLTNNFQSAKGTRMQRAC